MDTRSDSALRNPLRAAALMIFSVLVLFAFAIGAAVGIYPGGTHFNPDTVGYSFLYNFWCDALYNPALNGEPNPRGARLASIALWVLSAGLLPFWGMLAELVAPGRRHARLTRLLIEWLGIWGMLGMMAVALVPSDRYPFLHGFVVTTAGPIGILAATLAIFKSWSSPRMPRFTSALGTLALLAALANLAQYARQFWLDAPSSLLLPAIQKVATVFFLSWVAAVAAVAFSGRWIQRRRRTSREDPVR